VASRDAGYRCRVPTLEPADRRRFKLRQCRGGTSGVN
jgi:hypothetical protein